MYIAYEIKEEGGMEYVNPVGVLKNRKDANLFKDMSYGINIEKIPMIDMRNIRPIRHIEFWYYKDGSYGYSERITNSLFVKNIEKFNRVHILNGHMKIVKVINETESSKEVAEKLKNICPKLLLKKELDELNNSEESGVRMNSLFVQIDVRDLLEKI